MVIYLILLLIISYIYLYRRRTSAEVGWGFPILGHLPLMGRNPAKTLMEWGHKYGPIFFVRFGTSPTLVVNDGPLIQELFNFPEASGRMYIQYIDTVSKRRGLNVSDGPHIVEMRRFIVRTFRDFGYGKASMEDRIQMEIAKLMTRLQSLVDGGKKLVVKHFFNVALVNAQYDLMMSSTFSLHGNNADAMELVHAVDDVVRSDSAAQQLGLFVPWFGRILSFLGLSYGELACEKLYGYFEKTIEERKQSWTLDQPRDLTDVFLDKLAKTKDKSSPFHPENKHQAATTAELFAAGVETQSTALEWLTLYMATHPDIQRKVQGEIDQFIGGRQPNLLDRPKMHYCQATINEVLRIITVLPFGVPHRALEDFTFHGHLVRKDTIILGNTYAAQMDPKKWDEPNVFRPERFLDIDGKFIKNVDNFLPFGIGRRNCIGESLARDQLFLFCSSIFQKFTIGPGDKPISMEPVFGLTMSIPPCELVLSERSKL